MLGRCLKRFWRRCQRRTRGWSMLGIYLLWYYNSGFQQLSCSVSLKIPGAPSNGQDIILKSERRAFVIEGSQHHMTANSQSTG